LKAFDSFPTHLVATKIVAIAPVLQDDSLDLILFGPFVDGWNDHDAASVQNDSLNWIGTNTHESLLTSLRFQFLHQWCIRGHDFVQKIARMTRRIRKSYQLHGGDRNALVHRDFVSPVILDVAVDMEVAFILWIWRWNIWSDYVGWELARFAANLLVSWPVLSLVSFAAVVGRFTA